MIKKEQTKFVMVEITYVEFNNNVPTIKAGRIWVNNIREGKKLAKMYAKSPECNTSTVFMLIRSKDEGEPSYIINKKWEYGYRTWRNILDRK